MISNNTSVIVFDYNGNNIPFELTGNDVMINATKMAKACGKRVNNYTQNSGFQDLVNAVSSVTGIPVTGLIITNQGGVPQNQGTWFHRLIAIHFAMWCDPIFGVWCLQKLDEIIQRGYAFRDAEIQRLNGVIQDMQPQVDYYNKVLQTTETLYTTRDICQELGLRISNKQFIKELISRNYAYRDKKKVYLKSPWNNQGYRKTVTEKCNDGVLRSVTRWTESGKHWLWSLALDWKLI